MERKRGRQESVHTAPKATDTPLLLLVSSLSKYLFRSSSRLLWKSGKVRGNRTERGFERIARFRKVGWVKLQKPEKGRKSRESRSDSPRF